MTILRSGASKDYSNNWGKAFGESAKKPTKKAAAKKKATKAKKKSAKKKS
jgi:hypothetical protein